MCVYIHIIHGEGIGYPLQYSPAWRILNMDRGAWWATVHGVAKSRIPLSYQAQNAHTHTHTHTHAHIYMKYPQEVPPCTPPNHNPSLPPKEQWMFLWSGWQVSPWSRRGWTRMWWECHQPLGSSTSLCKFGYNFNFFAFKRIILPPKRVSLDTIV